MHLSREELRKIDKQFIDSLPGKKAKELCLLFLDDIKELHERLGQNSENSSMSPGSNFPWAQFEPDVEEPDEELDETAHIERDDSDEESAEHDEDADNSDQQDSSQNTDNRPNAGFARNPINV